MIRFGVTYISAKAMRIALIGQKGIPHVQGGVEKHVEDLSVSLAKRGNDVFVYTRPQYVDPKMTQYKGVHLLSLPTINSKHLDAIIHTLLACIDVSFRQKADIIHFHSIGPASLLWLTKLLNPRTPIIATFHSRCYLHDKWNWFAQKYLQFGEYMTCKFAARTIVISRILQRYTRDKYDRDAVFIPNGVKIKPSLSEDLLAQWDLTHGEYVLFVGRLIRIKRVHDLITAFNKVSTFKKLVIVGDGSFSDDCVKELKKLASNNKNIVFTGQQDGETLQQLYTHAYLFVLPSEVEGLSISLLEAFACGTPVLVSNIAENADVVRNYGFMYKMGNTLDLARVMQDLLNNPIKTKRHRVAAQRYSQLQYDWGKLAEQTEHVYIESIHRKRSSTLQSLERTR